MNRNAKPNPELLAPVGSLECFHAAVEAGADAVYLGIGDYHARQRANNFTIKTLAYLVPYAREREVNVYVTVNTLIKQAEFRDLIYLLHQLEQLQVDALIVQDLGVVRIAKRHFPGQTLHASTQMAIHNSLGAEAALKLGLERAILSRELTLEEIGCIAKETAIELELFVHGALCYSLSGLCLASSYLGGRSGNRGRCTQACRRQYSDGSETGFFFSAKDLCALDYLEEFRELGIASLKIEGRMKGAEYVYQVVSAYRQALDGGAETSAIREALRMDFGREKTSFFLPSPFPEDLIAADAPAGTGIFLGRVTQVSDRILVIPSEIPVRPGDRIRLHRQTGERGKGVSVIASKFQGALLHLTVGIRIEAKKGNLAYLVSRKDSDENAWSGKKLDRAPVFPQNRQAKVGKLLAKVSKRPSCREAEKLYIRIDGIDWLNLLKTIPFDRLVLNGSREEFEGLLQTPKQLRHWRERLILELPPFIPEGELPEYRSLIARLRERGLTSWMCGHFSQSGLFAEDIELHAGNSVWTNNRATQNLLAESRFATFQYSLEEEILNLKAIAAPNGVLPLFGYVPLFVSRIRPPTRPGGRLFDSRSDEFRYFAKGNLHYLIGGEPVCLFHRREKMESLGITSFLLDFSFAKPSRRWMNTLLFHYRNRKRLPDTTLFNHKRGLK